MLYKKLFLFVGLLAIALPTSVSAAIIQFDLKGVAGDGLRPGNEPGAITGGTGGEIGTGITFNDATNILSINVGWGTSQGFVDLTSASNNSHIHGATLTNNGNGFTETAGVLFNLTRSSNLATGGTISQDLTYTAAQAADLLAGKHYLNIHTATNGGGELRGFLVQAVPEPSSIALFGICAVGLSVFAIRKRKTKA